MRGGVLSDPAVVGMLQPFLVTYWYGHRDSPMPDVVRQHLRSRRGRRDLASNVFLMVLDADGRLVHAFDAFPHRAGGPHRRVVESVKHELASAIERVGAARRRRPAPLRLPDLVAAADEPAGVRVFVRVLDDRMRAYRTPVVEVVPLARPVWNALAYPSEPRRIDAALLLDCLAQLYPPGVMERTDPRTKLVHRIVDAAGALDLAAVGSSRSHRYAILRGRVRLTDDGADGFSYTGELECVLRYAPRDDSVESLRGTFDAIYPRPTRDGIRDVRLIAAIESRPSS